MQDIHPEIEYCRVIHTDGHCWKLYEVHRSHVKKTKFFEPRDIRRQVDKKLMTTPVSRFFDDYEHMLSVIGLIRFGLGIGENIVEMSEVYDVQELEDDPTRTIKKSYLSQSSEAEDHTGTKLRVPHHAEVVQRISHDREKDQ